MNLLGLTARLSFAVIALAISCLAFRADAQTPPRTVVILGGTLIDATARPPLENAVIVIEGERIKTVGKQGDVAYPKDSRIINMKGKTLLPGLIDGHCHLVDFMGDLYLHLGITTCPDITQNEDEWTLAQRDGTAL
jgi:predicted amidohydrolase YtcJ